MDRLETGDLINNLGLAMELNSEHSHDDKLSTPEPDCRCLAGQFL